MIIESITAEGFLSYGVEQTLQLGGRGVVAIVGPNGIGKSTIASKALTWCLYGKCAPELMGAGTRSLAGKEIVTEGAKNCRVLVTLANKQSGAVYTIERSRTLTKADRIATTGPGAESSQEWIDHIIGGDFDVFTRTIVRGQDDPWNFAGATDARKREILDVVSGANKLAIPHHRAKELARSSKVIAESHRRAITDALRRVDTLNLVDLQRQADAWEGERANRVKIAYGELRHFDGALTAAKASDESQEANKTKRKALEANAPALDLVPFQNAERAAYRQLTQATANMNAAKTAQQQAQKLVKEGKCPTCQKPITPGDPLHSLSTVEIATDTHTALQSAHAQAVQALTAAENWFRTAQQIHKAALDAIPPIGPPKAPAFATSVDLAKRRITDIETAANPWQAQVQLATTQRYALQREIAVLQELAISAETEQRIADVWVDALAPTGARAHMAEGTLAAIESEANRWLSALSDGHLAVQFAPTKETAQGAVKDQIQTIVTFDGKERSFLAFSGGQKKRVNFAVDLGVASAFSRGGSLALSLLVLDEQLFSGLDEEGKRAVVHALNAAGVADVVVIDHDPALAMALPRAFQIVKAADKFSRIEAIR